MLFRVFLPRILKLWALIIGITIVLGVFFEKFWPGNLSVLYSNFVIFGFIIAFIQSHNEIPKNINWILAYPISRKIILLSKYILSIFHYLIFIALNSAFKAIVPTKLPVDELDIANINLLEYPQTIAILFCLFWLINLSAINITNIVYTRTTLNYVHQSSLKIKFALFFILIVALFELTLDSSILFTYYIFTILFIFVTIHGTFFTIKLNKKLRNQVFLALFVLASMQYIWMYQTFTHLISDPSYKYRISAIEFMGWIGPGLSQKELANEFKKPRIDNWGMKTKIKNYLETYNSGKKISNFDDQFLPFEEVVKSKYDWQSLSTALSLYDLGQVPKDKQKFLFSIISNFPEFISYHSTYLSLFALPQSKSDLIEMLESATPVEFMYAVMKERYEQDLDSISHIEAKMFNFDDRVRLSALKTLSVLYGKYIGLDLWPKYTQEHKLDILPSPMRPCDQIKFDLERLSEQDLIDINRCVRKRANLKDPSLLGNIESLGWISSQIDKSQKDFLYRVFNVPRHK